MANNLNNCSANQNTPPSKTLWLFFILVCLIEFGSYFAKHNGPYLFMDTDAFMRMVRVEALVDSRDWYNHYISRSNFPFGEELHWSRAFDILLIGLSLPFRLFFDTHTAIKWSGVIISPLLKMLSLPALFWATRAFLTSRNAFRACILFLTQWGVIQYFAFCRPDHHSLLILIYLLFLGAALRTIDRPSGSMPCLTGFLSGIEIWLSPEALLPIAILSLFLFIHWIYNKASALIGLIKYQSTLLIFSALAILIERPPSSFTSIVYDKLSFVHLCIFALFLLQLLCLNRFYCFQHSQKRRFIASVFGSLIVFSVINFIFPDFLKGPFVMVDKQTTQLWLSQVSEVQPLRFTSLTEISTTVAFMGSLLFTCILLIRQIFTHSLCDNPKKVFLFLSLLVFSFLAFRQLRWSLYAEIIVVLYNTILLSWCLDKVQTCKRPLCVILGQTASWSLIGLGHLLCVFLLSIFISAPNAPVLNEEPLHAVDQVLSSENNRFTILTHIDCGPQILYETKHNIIATPYHRNTAGILFWFDTMASTDMDAVKNALQSRNVTHILIDPQKNETFLSANPNNFFTRLLNKTALPPWLEPVAFPSNQASSFLFYKVAVNEP